MLTGISIQVPATGSVALGTSQSICSAFSTIQITARYYLTCGEVGAVEVGKDWSICIMLALVRSCIDVPQVGSVTSSAGQVVAFAEQTVGNIARYN